MNLSLNADRRSATVKVIAIGLLILALLIPIGMVKGVVYDRMQAASNAASDIRNSWGGQQLVAGPLLRLPYKAEAKNSHGGVYLVDQYALLVADELTGDAKVEVENRYRGIHEVPVYQTELEINVRFDLKLLERLNLPPDAINWSLAEIVTGMADPAAMNEVPQLVSATHKVEFAGTSHQIEGLPKLLSAPVGPALTMRPDADTFSANIRLSFNGTERLQFVPFAEQSQLSVSADWPSPSFSGRRLPATRSINEDGFEASWESTSIGRNIPASWVEGRATPDMHLDGVFGVRFMTPIGLYQLMDRALKYAIMFIGLTFITYFLMETVAKIRLHPLQYLLVGLANSLFYLLLLSLAEHIGFGPAYVISATGSAALIVSYSLTVLATKQRTSVMAAVLFGLYGFLYLTLMAESFALLAGSIGLWFVLGAIMFLTRKVDWYTAAETNQELP